MRRSIPLLALAALLGGCVVAPAPAPGRYATALPPPPRADPWCQQQRQEARVAQRIANQEAREASYYGGRRQAYEAAATQAEADRQRVQANRAC